MIAMRKWSIINNFYILWRVVRMHRNRMIVLTFFFGFFWVSVYGGCH